jgi:hypothetical protein
MVVFASTDAAAVTRGRFSAGSVVHALKASLYV